MELIFATNNLFKVQEIRSILGSEMQILPLKEAGIDIDIPEPFDTLEENARTKAQTIHGMTGKDCFSEDTGLEVEALNGEPGVKSARYAGDGRSFEDNITKLLQNLAPHPNRKARFRTVISLILAGQLYEFEGVCPGQILNSPQGSGGFGYDPVFVPDGDTRSFAEMTLEEKNRYSHRKIATAKLVAFLQTKMKS